MSPYVLDTDTLTLYQAGHPAVCQRCTAHPSTDLAVTVISVEEQLSGWCTRLRRCKRRDELARAYERLTQFVRFVSRLHIISFPETAILRYEHLNAQNLNIGKMDLRIAAIVLEVGGTLVTRNLRDFQRVPGLALEDGSV